METFRCKEPVHPLSVSCMDRNIFQEFFQITRILGPALHLKEMLAGKPAKSRRTSSSFWHPL